jgi:hypothetical protein
MAAAWYSPTVKCLNKVEPYLALFAGMNPSLFSATCRKRQLRVRKPQIDFPNTWRIPPKVFKRTEVAIHQGGEFGRIRGRVALMKRTVTMTLWLIFSGAQIYADLSFDRREFDMTKNMLFFRVCESVRVRIDLYVEPKS